jgi:hypothetical protein
MKKSRRTNMRKSRRSSRRSRRRSRRASRRQSGGWVVMNPAGVADNSMAASAKLNLAQGGEYKEAHKGQYGGGAPLEGAPVGTTGVLDSSLRTSAYLGPLDKSMEAIQGMSDQAGGGKRRKRGYRFGNITRGLLRMLRGKRGGGKRGSKRARGSKRRQRGGATVSPADVGAPGTLLPASLANKAMMQMNPEWKLAEDPAAFAPRA